MNDRSQTKEEVNGGDDKRKKQQKKTVSMRDHQNHQEMMTL